MLKQLDQLIDYIQGDISFPQENIGVFTLSLLHQKIHYFDLILLDKLEIVLLDADSSETNYSSYGSLVKGPTSSSHIEDDAILLDDDVVLLLFSSGTTGAPKGVMITNGNLKAHILQIAVDEYGYYNPPVSGIFENLF